MYIYLAFEHQIRISLIFFIPFFVSYGMALSLQRMVSVCPSLMLSKLFAWCSQAIHWSVVVVVGATANFFFIHFFSVHQNRVFHYFVRYLDAFLLLPVFFFALRHCNNANNSKWLVRKERSFECKKKKYKRNELVKKPTYCQTHIHICKEHIALDKNRSTSRMCLSGERKREKKSSETSHFCCGCEKLTFLMASNGVECTDNLFE